MKLSTKGRYAMVALADLALAEAKSTDDLMSLAAIAKRAPQSLDDLQDISGMGAKKLEAYADAVLRVMAQCRRKQLS